MCKLKPRYVLDFLAQFNCDFSGVATDPSVLRQSAFQEDLMAASIKFARQIYIHNLKFIINLSVCLISKSQI